MSALINVTNKEEIKINVTKDENDEQYIVYCDKIISHLVINEGDGFGGKVEDMTIIFLNNGKVYKLFQERGIRTPQYVSFEESPIITELQEIAASDIAIVKIEEENEN